MVILSTTQIDAFLLDIDMPGTNGISLCRKIRQKQGCEAVPILFITGDRSSLEESFSAGCDDFIDKPIDALVLRARLRSHLQRAEYAKLLNSTRKMLDQYVSKRTREVVEKAAQTGILPQPTKREVVILFTDIRGFTALSEEIDSDELFSLISTHLAMQVHLIHEYGGYVDKFGGDGLMAVFDAAEMATQSCLCALEIMEKARHAAEGDPRIRQLSIGIHMGSVVIGNLGSPEHLDYSAIGSAVNLAARLCGHAEPMSVVVSSVVREAAMDADYLHFKSERKVAIRGLREPIAVYTLAKLATASS
jgi:adenylate cyclase